MQLFIIITLIYLDSAWKRKDMQFARSPLEGAARSNSSLIGQPSVHKLAASRILMWHMSLNY